MLELFGFDRNDPGDLEDFAKWLFNVCLWVFVILASVVMIYTIFGDGTIPPEPENWLIFKAWVFNLLSQ